MIAPLPKSTLTGLVWIGRVAVLLLVLAVAYPLIASFATYQREYRIAKQIWATAGAASFTYCGPAWIPDRFQPKLKFYFRITSVTPMPPANDFRLSKELLAEISSLRDLACLDLSGTSVRDENLHQFRQLPKLWYLNLSYTKVTDEGLAVLQTQPTLTHLIVDSTDTTPQGRAAVRKALPRCKVVPDP